MSRSRPPGCRGRVAPILIRRVRLVAADDPGVRVGDRRAVLDAAVAAGFDPDLGAKHEVSKASAAVNQEGVLRRVALKADDGAVFDAPHIGISVPFTEVDTVPERQLAAVARSTGSARAARFATGTARATHFATGTTHFATGTTHFATGTTRFATGTTRFATGNARARSSGVRASLPARSDPGAVSCSCGPRVSAAACRAPRGNA
jgi:hypothetical protein